MKREWVWAIISLLIAIVLSYILLSIARDEALSKVEVGCLDSVQRENIRAIMLKAADRGLEEQVVHLFEIWVRDPSVEQPKRAQVGANNAVNAHIRARKAAIAWSPPEC